MTIVDLCSGPGGWASGAASLGLVTVGIERDRDACLTHHAAGHATIRADIATFPLEHLHGIEGLIASPPCPDFSLAGKGAGIDGDTGRLMLEVPRWVEALRPRWVACEQVPPAIEWYERFAHGFQRLGYATWCGILNAADYGVPQTRRRAFLLASLDREPRPPEPTHGRDPQPQMFGEPILPWVSMADALGWGIDDRPCVTVTGGGTETGGAEPVTHPKRAAAAAAARGEWVVRTGANSMVTGREAHDVQPYERSVEEPAPTLDAKAGSAWTVGSVNTGLWWKKGQDRSPVEAGLASGPAPSLTGKSGGQWHLTRPATTVMGDARLWPPGHKVNQDDRDRLGTDEADARYGDRAGSEAIRLSIADALILQSFPADYPMQGTKTSQFRQIGNAVPPALAAAVLGQLTNRTTGRTTTHPTHTAPESTARP